jgi:hypothetical protein
MADLPQKALSIRQPWLWAILYAGKRIENRPRRFNYRGPICLHASSTFTTKAWIEAENSILTISGKVPPHEHAEFIRAEEMCDRGGIIGTAEIVDCIDSSDSPWFFGPYGLVLKNVKPVDFIPVRGSLGLFNWRKNLESSNA